MADKAEHHTGGPDLNAQRAMALSVISDLVTVHGLPMPQAILFQDAEPYRYPGIELRLGEGDRDGVQQWATALGLTPQPDETFNEAYGSWTSVRAVNRRNPGQPAWLYFEAVDVWASCDRGKGARGGEQS